MMNRKHGLTGKHKVNNMILFNYLSKKKIDESPEKKGRASIIHLSCADLLMCHVSMKQLEGIEEVKPKKLKALIGAAIKNTEYESLSPDNVYVWLRDQKLEAVTPTKSMLINGLTAPRIASFTTATRRTSPCESWIYLRNGSCLSP